MAFSPQFRLEVEQKLSAVRVIRTKAMFGGVAIYAEDRIFALIAGEQLYLKANETSRTDYEAAGMSPFYPSDAPNPMPYWELPPGVLEDPKELSVWVDKAVGVAHSTKPAARRTKRTSGA